MAEGHAPLKHIWYANGELSICQDRVVVPDDPIRFDAQEGEPCPKCDAKMTRWIIWWTGSNNLERTDV